MIDRRQMHDPTSPPPGSAQPAPFTAEELRRLARQCTPYGDGVPLDQGFWARLFDTLASLVERRA